MPSFPSQRRGNLVARLFPPRQIFIRNNTGYTTLNIGTGSQVLAVLALYLTTTALAFGLTGFLTGQARLTLGPAPGDDLAAAPAEPRSSRELPNARLRQVVADLARAGSEQRETIEGLTELRATLERELQAAQDEIRAVSEERDAAARQAAERELQATVAAGAAAGAAAVAAGASASAPAGDARARADLAGRLAQAEARLAAAASERDRLARTERGLRWRVEMLETRLAEMRQSVSAEAGRLRQWIVGQVSALEGVLATSGVDVDRLIRRVDSRLGAGQGGPFEPLPSLGAPRRRGGGPGGAAFLPTLGQEMARLRAVHALLQSMPLAAPMHVYRTNSGFGVRRDPLTGRPAMHAGLDFGGPDDAEVLATAPGQVVTAGRAGAYGLLVEIDHGMGIRTRYGHLQRLLVKAGDRVAPRQPVGIMGSTGRSTGDHLHYEVRVDGAALDPAPFLEAGRQLRDVFKG